MSLVVRDATAADLPGLDRWLDLVFLQRRVDAR
jgi:hypothetical protein